MTPAPWVRGVRPAGDEPKRRAPRQPRPDALAEVVTALEWFYRDALVACSAEAVVGSAAAVEALDACPAARGIIVARTAINEALLLGHLLVHLPPAANLEAPAPVLQWDGLALLS